MKRGTISALLCFSACLLVFGPQSARTPRSLRPAFLFSARPHLARAENVAAEGASSARLFFIPHPLAAISGVPLTTFPTISSVDVQDHDSSRDCPAAKPAVCPSQHFCRACAANDPQEAGSTGSAEVCGGDAAHLLHTAWDRGKSSGKICRKVGSAGCIFSVPAGVLIEAGLQGLRGEVTREGLWLRSTEGVCTKGAARFSLRAVSLGRVEQAALPGSGEVRMSGDIALWVREGLVEEYRGGADGVRQDFVVAQSPRGEGELSVEVEVRGAKVATASGDAVSMLTIKERRR